MKTTSEKLKTFLWKCLVINFFILILLSLTVFLANELYAIHSQWFLASKEEFVIYIYYFIALYKILWIFFNVVPYFALRMIDKKEADS